MDPPNLSSGPKEPSLSQHTVNEPCKLHIDTMCREYKTFPTYSGDSRSFCPKGVAPKFSTYTSEMQEFPTTEQDSLSSTISHKETVGQETSTKGVLPTATSLEKSCGCDTCTKDVLGHIPSVEKVMDPTISE